MKNFKNKLLYLFQFVLFSINYIKPNNFDEARFYKENISGEAIIFDVGANLGTFTSFVTRTLKNINLNIYAFEPNKELTSGYSKIKILNGRLNIENIGISNQEGKATFMKEIYHHIPLCQKKTYLNFIKL